MARRCDGNVRHGVACEGRFVEPRVASCELRARVVQSRGTEKQRRNIHTQRREVIGEGPLTGTGRLYAAAPAQE